MDTCRGDVTLTSAWRGEDVLALGVVDTGVGISEEEQESIFQPFERGWWLERDSGGSGMGLAVVDRLVAELGLQLEVRSEYGRGMPSTCSYRACSCAPLVAVVWPP